MVTVAQVTAIANEFFPPALAESWDAVGLVCGRPDSEVTRILVTVDVTAEVVEEALTAGVDFILAHHPLLLTGVHGVAATDVKGQIVHALIEGGCALLTAHTNADAADPGVSDALARAVGLTALRPLDPIASPPADKIVVFVPPSHAAAVLDAMAAAGAGSIGDYDRCAYSVEGTGTFRPLDGADPYTGSIGEIAVVDEQRLEMILPRSARSDVVTAMLDVHPYEEPAFDVVELASLPSAMGIGRIGELAAPISLRRFVKNVAESLPFTVTGVRYTGDRDALISTVAVCGGSGGSYLELANKSGADAYLTADLKHHQVSDHAEAGGCALIDVAHWASEFPWCEQVAAQLSAYFEAHGVNVSIDVSDVVTDPWEWRLRSES